MALPSKPSELIRLALSDLAKCERSPKYVIDMGEWHLAPDVLNEPCVVCFAGSVMAESLGVSHTNDYTPSDFDYETYEVLTSLDYFRRGLIDDAFSYLDMPDSEMPERRITAYEDDPKQFRADMFKLCCDLEATGC